MEVGLEELQAKIPSSGIVVEADEALCVLTRGGRAPRETAGNELLVNDEGASLVARGVQGKGEAQELFRQAASGGLVRGIAITAAGQSFLLEGRGAREAALGQERAPKVVRRPVIRRCLSWCGRSATAPPPVTECRDYAARPEGVEEDAAEERVQTVVAVNVDRELDGAGDREVFVDRSEEVFDTAAGEEAATVVSDVDRVAPARFEIAVVVDAAERNPPGTQGNAERKNEVPRLGKARGPRRELLPEVVENADTVAEGDGIPEREVR